MDRPDENALFLDADGPVNDTLEALRTAIRNRARIEQLRDQLTDLPNGAARDEWIDRSIEQDSPRFWLAFIEVDRFKSVNDKYGYESADLMLKSIAKELRNSLAQMPGFTVPFRAHGDEFFLAGPLPDSAEEISARLDHLRRGIELLKVPSQEGPLMAATVSIGWVCSEDLNELERRPLLFAVERAVDHAKAKGRNCVVRYDAGMHKGHTADGRADCASCRTKFSLSVPVEARRTASLLCPNCAAPIDRPHSLHPPAPVSE